MKTNLLRTSLVAVLAAAAAFAQSSTRLQATVPFDFLVGNKALPAGDYTVAGGPAAGTIMIRSADGKKGAIVLAQEVYLMSARESARLIFHRYGSTYFLSEVEDYGSVGHKLRPTSREHEMEAKRASPESAVILARK